MRRPLCYLCLAFFATVFLYLYLLPPKSTTLQVEEGGILVCEGSVYQKEYKNDQLLLYLEHVQIYQNNKANLNLSIMNSQIKNLKMICYMKDKKEPKTGADVVVKGQYYPFSTATNPGEFDQAFYQLIQDVQLAVYKAELMYETENYSCIKETLFQLRRRLERIVDSYFTPDDAAVIKAMLLGNKEDLTKERKKLFQSSGIAHILAISGVHISILGMGLYHLLRRFRIPKPVASFFSILCMILYGETVGMSSSSLRAIVMFIFQIAAMQFKRTYDLKTTLAVAAAGILMEQPLYIFHAGFLLSFGAVFGIGCLDEIFDMKQNGIIAKFFGSLRVFLIQFPILVHFYYSIPVYSIFLNLLIIPMATLILIAGIFCIFAGFVPVLGEILACLAALCCHFLLASCEKMCEIVANTPFTTWIIGERSWWKYVMYYVVIFFLIVSEKYARDYREGKIGLSVNLKLLLILVTVMCFVSPEYKGMEMTFLDVGQGDCIFLRNENGNAYLIDGGSSSRQKVSEYLIAPFLKYKGVQKLEIVFLTHMDADHVNGIMELLEQEKDIQVEKIAIPVFVEKNEYYFKLVDICKRRKIDIIPLKQGNQIRDCEMNFMVLSPHDGEEYADSNEGSLVLQIEFGSFHALLTGDAGEAAESTVIREVENWKCNVLKVAHHGSKYSSSLPFLEQIDPDISVISSGEGNMYGHPHEDTLNRLQQIGSEIVRTDQSGAISVFVNQGICRVKSYMR